MSNEMTPLVLVDGIKNPEFAADLMDVKVHVTEKIVGVPWACRIDRPTRPESYATTSLYVGGTLTHEDDDYNTLFDQRLDYFLDELLRLSTDNIESVLIEGVWLPGSPYFNPSPEVRLFSIEVNGLAVPPEETFRLFSGWGVKAVPVLSLYGQTLGSWLARRPLTEAAKGRSRLAAIDRFGVVIRPIEEMNHPAVGRLVVQLEADYRESEESTEADDE